jgi:hypothetical protein
MNDKGRMVIRVWYSDSTPRGRNNFHPVQDAAALLDPAFILAQGVRARPNGKVKLTNHSGRVTSITIMQENGLDSAGICAVRTLNPFLL